MSWNSLTVKKVERRKTEDGSLFSCHSDDHREEESVMITDDR
jgi:hypothetical protein